MVQAGLFAGRLLSIFKKAAFEQVWCRLNDLTNGIYKWNYESFGNLNRLILKRKTIFISSLKMASFSMVNTM